MLARKWPSSPQEEGARHSLTMCALTLDFQAAELWESPGLLFKLPSLQKVVLTPERSGTVT